MIYVYSDTCTCTTGSNQHIFPNHSCGKYWKKVKFHRVSFHTEAEVGTVT